MSKRELIDAIRVHNRSVAPEFLARFAETELKAYLDRICLIMPAVPPPRVNASIDAKRSLIVA